MNYIKVIKKMDNYVLTHYYNIIIQTLINILNKNNNKM